MHGEQVLQAIKEIKKKKKSSRPDFISMSLFFVESKREKSY